MTKLIELMVVGAVCAFLLPPSAYAVQDDGADAPSTQAVFRAKYDDWLKVREAALRGPAGASDVFDVEAVFDNDAFRALVGLGLRVLPIMMEAVHRDSLLGYPMFLITKWRYHEVRTEQNGITFWTVEEYPDMRQRRTVDAVAVWARWWNEGAKGVDERYAGLKARWATLSTAERTTLWTTEAFYTREDQSLHEQRTRITEAGRVYAAVQGVGIAVLPSLVGDLQKGHFEFLDIALALTGRPAHLPGIELPATRRAQAFLAWWEQNKQDWLIPWPDEPTPELPAPQP